MPARHCPGRMVPVSLLETTEQSLVQGQGLWLGNFVLIWVRVWLPRCARVMGDTKEDTRPSPAGQF